MESEKFSYTGPGINDALLGGGIELYSGGILGFRSDTNIVNDYAGPFLVFQGGLSFDIFVGIGVGTGGFLSTSDPFIRGDIWYVGGSLSATDWLEVFDIGGAYLIYKSLGSRTSYVLADGSVDRSRLLLDIMSGANSPWPLSMATKSEVLLYRLSAYTLALHYAKAYEELIDGR
ncbi:MAG: hypothetical protein WAV05_10505 [Anaerolineales bacterium]